MTIHLGPRFSGGSSGAPGSSAGRLVAEPVRLAPDGVWRAAVSPRRWWALTPPFHPCPGVSGENHVRRWRSPFCATFRRLSPPGVSPASCPAVSGLSSDRRSGPRSPGLQPQLYPPRLLTTESRTALRAVDAPLGVEEELAAGRAFQARAAEERENLLVERPVERDDLHRLDEPEHSDDLAQNLHVVRE